MGRKKAIEDDVLAKLMKRYVTEELGNSGNKVKAANLVKYIQQQGYPDFKDFHLRKEPGASLLKEIKAMQANKTITTLVVHKPIDVEGFLTTNKTHKDFVKALTQLDSYYKRIAESANTVIKDFNYMTKKIESLIRERAELMAELESTKIALSKIKENEKQLKDANKTMKEYIKLYIHPEIAHTLFCEDGIMSGDVAPHLNSDVLNSQIIRGEDDITQFINLNDELNAIEAPDVPLRCDEDGVVIEDHTEDNGSSAKIIKLDFIRDKYK